MNRNLLQQYIAAYEANFEQISNDEIYKWRAVKTFQDNWKPEAEDFAVMLETSLSGTSNLLVSGNYFPERMIVEYASYAPQLVRNAFEDLFDEERELLERVSSFREQIEQLNERESPQKSTYQDDRAIMVYLCLRYPDIYYLYKYEMFREFVQRIGYDYRARKKRVVNIVPYLQMCDLVREELVRNNGIMEHHRARIGVEEYPDPESHILTQDFIYAVTRFPMLDQDSSSADIESRLTLTSVQLNPVKKTYSLKGQSVDYEARQKHNKRLGSMGEELVLREERAKYGDRVEHKSRTEGDGLGYDILSFDGNGHEVYIEVKTTKLGPSTSFFVTQSELECSQRHSDKYRLYRLYNFDANTHTANYFIVEGDLSPYCINPLQYQAVVELGSMSEVGQIGES